MRNSASNVPLQGQVAVITGAGRGIGRAIAMKLAELGAHTVLCGRSLEALKQTSTAIEQAAGETTARTAEKSSGRSSAKTTAIACDVTELASVEALAERVERSLGRLDILVNNAGIGGPSGPLHLLEPSEWERVLNTNLRGVYYCVRSLAPMMIKAGAGQIINISSLAGKNPLANGAAYAASKWGLNGLTSTSK